MKKNQIRKLFLENFDGTLPFKENCFDANRITYYITQIFIKYVNFIAVKEHIEYRFQQDEVFKYVMTNVEDQYLEYLRHSIFSDEYSRVFGATYKFYYESKDRKNYIISGPLTKYLSKISLDVPVEILPENFTAYFEPTELYDEIDGAKILCAFIHIGKVGDDKVLTSAMITEGPKGYESFNAYKTYSGLLGNVKTLDELKNDFNQFEKYENGEFNNSFGRPVSAKMSESLCHRTIVNAVIYVNGPNEDFIEQFNEFSSKESKRKVQIKSLTQKKVIRIGFTDAEILKLIAQKEINVSWHIRNQPYGPERKLRKKIVIAPYKRKIKSYIDK